MSLPRPPPGNRPEPRNRLTRDIETRLNLTPPQKIEILEKLAELQKKEKFEAPDRVDHPLQITKVLGDFFGDQIRYYEFTSSNKKTEGSNWSRKELLDRRKCFLIDNFHEFYKGEKVLFDQDGQLLEFLMTHYEHCEERLGGMLLHRDNAGKFIAVVQMKAKGKVYWTLPKGCRNLYTFMDNRSTYKTNLPVNQRLVPSSDPEGDLKAAVRKTHQGTGIPEAILNKHVQGYVKIENGIYEMKLFVFIVQRRDVKPADWDKNYTDYCKWVEWQFNRIEWSRLRDVEEVKLLPYQDTVSIDDVSSVFQRCFYFLKNLDKVIWTNSPPRESAHLFAGLKEKEASERRKAEKNLPPLVPLNLSPLVDTSRQNKPNEYTFMEALDLSELNSDHYSNSLLFSSNQLKSISRCSNMPGTSSNRSLPQAQTKSAPQSKDSLVTSRTWFHEKPSHHNQPSLLDSKAEYETKWRKPPKVPKDENAVHHDKEDGGVDMN